MWKDTAAGCWLTTVVARPTTFFYSTCNLKGKSERHELGRDQGKRCLVLFIRQEGRTCPKTYLFAFSPPRPCPAGIPVTLSLFHLSVTAQLTATVWNLEITLLFASP
ncbi:hypothetical protein PoB_006921200 [Plakobranchus ocellatus]|uniref:Uncharacterized protein n=1 Tax=Plakobranchus ocellatus TaxID=259542 RepID=A0AAV4DEP7_9GAST|nr:hypothetical protein PoB_006921200 [Plakobranchus ocellatus]